MSASRFPEEGAQLTASPVHKFSSLKIVSPKTVSFGSVRTTQYRFELMSGRRQRVRNAPVSSVDEENLGVVTRRVQNMACAVRRR
mmetsp:Transcript_65942/g.143654  ORF Transcript_65942/g.143654 Transcript_65942/m.143654 type:complete len:85 (-) Transcript_65942:118-372(-)